MNKSMLISHISLKTDLTHSQATAAVNGLLSTITEALKNGEKAAIQGFGTFELKERVARVVTVPATGERVEIAAKKTPVFRAGKPLKDAVK